ELALLLPLLCTLFLITIDFARVFFPSLTISSCARNGALYACDPVRVGESPYSDTQQAAQADATSLSLQPSVSSSNTVASDGKPWVRVQVDYSFHTITNYPGIPATVNVSRAVYMRVMPSLPSF